MRIQEREEVAALVWPDGEPPRWIEEPLLRSGQVALLFQVSRRTVSDWCRRGRLSWVVTPGGHRRFRFSEVRALVESVRGDGARQGAARPGTAPRSASAARTVQAGRRERSV